MIEQTKTQRRFILGDRWLYYKLYTGTKTTDTILSEVVLPLAVSLSEEQIIDQWFFIRYADPHHHLRLRFQYAQPENIGVIINRLQPYLQDLVEQDLIWKVQTDTYQRELERYGTNTINLAEKLFYYESEMIAGFIDLIEGDEGEEFRWLFALRAMDDLLDSFQYTLEEKLAILTQLKNGFAQEFHMNKYLKKQINDRYRNNRNKIDEFLNFTKESQPDYVPLLDLLAIKRNRSKKSIQQILQFQSLGKLEIPLQRLLSSFLHMLMNRLFKSKNRVHELICYDFLYRYYMATFSKQKAIQNKKQR